MGSIFTLWAGNANGDSKMQAAGASNDLSAIVSLVLNPTNGNNNLVRNYKVPGYRSTDVNMDGDTIAAGANNDVAVSGQQRHLQPDQPTRHSTATSPWINDCRRQQGSPLPQPPLPAGEGSEFPPFLGRGAGVGAPQGATHT